MSCKRNEIRVAQESVEIPSSLCSVKNCALCCADELPQGALFIGRTLTWSGILWVVFWCLHENEPSRTFFSLKEDVYPFVWITAHWEKLCVTKQIGVRVDSATVVKKKIQDALSHNRKMFTSGANKYRQNGFWKLRDRSSNPWGDAPSPPKSLCNKREREEYEAECSYDEGEDAEMDLIEKDFLDLKSQLNTRLNSIRQEVRSLREHLQDSPTLCSLPSPMTCSPTNISSPSSPALYAFSSPTKRSPSSSSTSSPAPSAMGSPVSSVCSPFSSAACSPAPSRVCSPFSLSTPPHLRSNSLYLSDNTNEHVLEVACSFEYMRDMMHERIDKMRDELQQRDDNFNLYAGNILADSNELSQHMRNMQNIMKRCFPPNSTRQK